MTYFTCGLLSLFDVRKRLDRMRVNLKDGKLDPGNTDHEHHHRGDCAFRLEQGAGSCRGDCRLSVIVGIGTFKPQSIA